MPFLCSRNYFTGQIYVKFFKLSVIQKILISSENLNLKNFIDYMGVLHTL